MKKTLAIILALLLGISMLSACGGMEEPPPLPPPREREKTPEVIATPEPPPIETTIEGFYTLVSLITDGEDVMELYIEISAELGMSTDDFYMEFLSNGIVRMGFFPGSEDEIEEGTFTVSGNSITVIIDGEETEGSIYGDRISFSEDDMEMVFQRNPGYTGPVFRDLPVLGSEIPVGGGSVLVSEDTDFVFSPGQTGLWLLRTSDNGDSDPMLEVYDETGLMIAEDDDGAGGLNAQIIIFLDGGDEYTIRAKFWSDSSDSFTLTVTHLDNLREIPADGGNFPVNVEEIFSFTPGKSGNWEFRTSDNGSSDPVLDIFDSDGVRIAGDDDSGDGMNALVSTRLIEGESYIIRTFTYELEDGAFTLNVTLK